MVSESTMQEGMAKEPVTLTVTGRATIQAAAALKERLATAIDAAAEVVVDVSGVSGADASFFQLLYAAQLTARNSGRCLTLSTVRSAEFLRAASATGFGLSPDGGGLDRSLL